MERLYYDDCYLKEFDAVVVEAAEDGRRIRLDRTAFYPTSGGQPFDTGQINESRVVDVLDEETGIVHLLDKPLSGAAVRGHVDWTRRFDHMQQHTGQHLLSAVFEELYGFKTVSFHLGAQSSTIELATPSVSPEQIRAAEQRANELIVENRAVQIAYEHAADAGALRKASDREGILRVVTIEGLDRSACGGTHVRATGEIGSILLRKTEKLRGNIRVEFLCGFRAVQRARKDFENLSDIALTFSGAIDETPALVKTQAARLADAEKLRRKTAGELAQAQGRELYSLATPSADGVRRHFESLQKGPLSEDTRFRAQSFTSQSQALYLATTAEPPSVLLAASSDSGVHAGEVLKAFLQSHGGRGGGNTQLAQGTVASAESIASLKSQLGFPSS